MIPLCELFVLRCGLRALLLGLDLLSLCRGVLCCVWLLIVCLLIGDLVGCFCGAFGGCLFGQVGGGALLRCLW